ncbi:MAG: hypothetical protein JSR73_10660 [Proteobacteria bacterium]|nr:hypothetical protein [Pseudomonadota bacterium]
MTAKSKTGPRGQFDLTVVPDYRAFSSETDPFGFVAEDMETKAGARRAQETFIVGPSPYALANFPFRVPQREMLRELWPVLQNRARPDVTFAVTIYDSTSAWFLHAWGDGSIQSWQWDGPVRDNHPPLGFDARFHFFTWDEPALYLGWWDGKELHAIPRVDEQAPPKRGRLRQVRRA